MNQVMAPAPAVEQELVVRRMIAASCAQLWHAWTDPAQLRLWWGPHGSTNTVHTLDARTGGTFHLTMHLPDGEQQALLGVFEEVVPGLRVTLSFSGAHVGAPGIRTSITCVEEDDAIVLTIRQGLPADPSLSTPMTDKRGWGQCLDRLEEWLLKGHVHND